MTTTARSKLDITAQWGRLNDGLITLIDYIPEEKLEWSPREGLWGFRRTLAHLAFARHNWTGNFLTQAIKPEDVWDKTASKVGIAEALRESWARVLRFASDQANLDRVYEGELDGQHYGYSGHWIAFHLLEHDIHHRASVFDYLALLGIEHPEVGTP